MITSDGIMAIEKDDLQEEAKKLGQEELPQLVQWLSEKNDSLRYQSLLLLQYRSRYMEDVYPFWDIFKDKLQNDNSYQRSIGLTLIAENTRWDKENKLDQSIDDYLKLLNDEKPITIRQCIQALKDIIPYKPQLMDKIALKLMSIDMLSVKETMRKLVLTDILNILISINKSHSSMEINSYVNAALTGGILDKKAIKLIEADL